MNNEDKMTSKAEFTEFITSLDQNTINCSATFRLSMGQKINSYGFVWGEGDIIPLLNTTGCFTKEVGNTDKSFGIDVNADGMIDYLGTTSQIEKYYNLRGIDAVILCDHNAVYSVRPYIILNSVSIIYGPVNSIQVNL